MDFDTAQVVWDEIVHARDLETRHIGKTFGAYDDEHGVDYLVTVWFFRTEKDGSVTMWLRHGAVPGRGACDDTLTVPADYLVKFVKVHEPSRTPVRI